MVKKLNKGELEGLEKPEVGVTAAVVGILGGIFFLSSGITGNVVSSFPYNAAGIIGAAMFVIGIASASFAIFKYKLRK